MIGSSPTEKCINATFDFKLSVQVSQDVDKRVPAVHVGIQGQNSQPQNIKGTYHYSWSGGGNN